MCTILITVSGGAVCLFALFIDDIIAYVNSQNVGCMYNLFNVSIILYADDILVLSPSAQSLQQLLSACDCEAKLRQLDLAINIKKSVCLRVGPRCHSSCSPMVRRYVGLTIFVISVYLSVALLRFSCSFDSAKRSFYRSFNAIFGKVCRAASEEVVLHLVKLRQNVCLFAILRCI